MRRAGCGHTIASTRGRLPKLCDRCKTGGVTQPAQPVEHNPGRGPEVVESWRRSVKDGTVGQRCDQLIRERLLEQGASERIADAIVAGRGLIADLPNVGVELVPRRLGDGRAAEPLTEREEQVLFAMADGLENSEIADELHLARETVRAHTKTVFRKLGARNRTHAVALAYHRGLLLPKAKAA